VQYVWVSVTSGPLARQRSQRGSREGVMASASALAMTEGKAYGRRRPYKRRAAHRRPRHGTRRSVLMQDQRSFGAPVLSHEREHGQRVAGRGGEAR